MGVVVTLCGRRHLSDAVRDPLYYDPGWKMEYNFAKYHLFLSPHSSLYNAAC